MPASSPRGSDIVVLYKAYAQEDPEEPRWRWPYGLVPLVGLGCNTIECLSLHRAAVSGPEVRPGSGRLGLAAPIASG